MIRHVTKFMLVLCMASAASSCNSSSGSGAASFAGSASGVTADAIADSYTKETTAPGGTVTVQGLNKVKLDNLCRVLQKISDNNPVVLTPSKWRMTRAFLIAHSSEMNYFCSQYNNLGDLFSAINLDPKEIHKIDLKNSIQNAADVLNGADVSAGPKKLLTTTIPGQCDNPMNLPKAPGGGPTGDQKTKKKALSGMAACGPAAVVGILLLDKDPSSLNADLTAASVACMALYGNLLKKNSFTLPAASKGLPGAKSKECKAADDKKKADGGGDESSGASGGGDSGGGGEG